MQQGVSSIITELETIVTKQKSTHYQFIKEWWIDYPAIPGIVSYSTRSPLILITLKILIAVSSRPNSPKMTAIPMMSEDIIHLRNIHLSAEIGADAWNRARPNRAQPIILSLKLYTDIAAAGNSDSIKDTFSYSHMCKDVLSKTDGKSFENIDEMAQSVGELLKGWPGKMLEVQILASKAILRAQGGLTKECCWRRENDDGIDKHTLESHAWIIKDLRLPCIIGVNPHERGEKQIVVINLRIVGEVGTSGYGFQMDEGRGTWARLVKQICLVSFGPRSL